MAFDISYVSVGSIEEDGFILPVLGCYKDLGSLYHSLSFEEKERIVNYGVWGGGMVRVYCFRYQEDDCPEDTTPTKGQINYVFNHCPLCDEDSSFTETGKWQEPIGLFNVMFKFETGNVI